MVCSLHSVTTGSRDRANVSLIIIILYWIKTGITNKMHVHADEQTDDRAREADVLFFCLTRMYYLYMRD